MCPQNLKRRYLWPCINNSFTGPIFCVQHIGILFSNLTTKSNESRMTAMKRKRVWSEALSFIFLMGIVSLFSDMTHEGARSVIGPFLSLTGASASTIGFISGLGELCGYSLRLISGPLADRSKKYWLFVILGYSI